MIKEIKEKCEMCKFEDGKHSFACLYSPTPQNCKECQFEEGHALTCSKYVKKDWSTPSKSSWGERFDVLLNEYAKWIEGTCMGEEPLIKDFVRQVETEAYRQGLGDAELSVKMAKQWKEVGRQSILNEIIKEFEEISEVQPIGMTPKAYVLAKLKGKLQ